MNRVCRNTFQARPPLHLLTAALIKASIDARHSRLVIPAFLLALAAPHLQAASQGGDRQGNPGTFGGVGGQGNGQGGAGGGYELAWNGATITNDGQGSFGTGEVYVADNSTNGSRGQSSSAALLVNSSIHLGSVTYNAATATDGGNGTGAGGTGGGGGGGGAGVAVSGDQLQINSAAVLIGGQGGSGGNGDIGGGGGGGGGAGLHANTSNSLLAINNNITGGKGGDAGNLSGGGGGGDGIVLNGNGTTINSTATISGGVGGQRGTGGTSSAQDGSSGVGVRINGNGNTLINSASIVGGTSNDGQRIASAVVISGDDNAVRLLPGSSFTGDVHVLSGSDNRLVIGEGASGTFDLSSLVRDLNTSYGGTRFAGFDILEKTGNGTWVLEGANSYTGSTEITQGNLIVGAASGSSASLTSNVTVASGTLLGGYGRIIGNVDLQAGSTLSPGNSIGTLNVTGDVTFSSASTLDIETNPNGEADKLIATGTVAINGATLNIIAANGTWLPSTSYTIIEANSVNGQFGQVTQNLPFLTPDVIYNPDNVVLTLNRNATSFASIGDTPNQTESARAVDGLAPSSPIAVAISTLDAEAAQKAYDSLSGEIHASTQSALLDDNRYLREGINARMLAVQGLAPAQGLLNADTGDTAFWLQSYGAQATSHGDGNGATFERDSAGVIFGGDLALNEHWRLGAALSLGRSDIEDARQSSVDVDSRSLALFASGQLDQFNLRIGASRSWHDIDSLRKVYAGPLTERDSAHYSATTDQVFAELGYRLTLDALQMEPFVGLTHARFSAESFHERGGSTALQSQGEKQETTLSSLGLRAKQPVTEVAGLPVSAQGSLAWQHAFGQNNATSYLSFAGAEAYRVESAVQPRNSARVEAGLAVQLAPSAAIELTYSGRFASDLHDDSLRLGISVDF